MFRLNVGCKQIAQIFSQVIVICSNRGHKGRNGGIELCPRSLCIFGEP